MSDLLKRINQLSPQQRELLLKKVQAQKTDLHSQVSVIKSIPRQQNIPLSFAQQRLWLLHQLIHSGEAYNTSGALSLKGNLKIDALHKSFLTVVNRHEVVRTIFTVKDGIPCQNIQPENTLYWRTIDWTNISETQQKHHLEQLIEQEFNYGFQLDQDCLLRLTLVQLSRTNHILVAVMHHIISDGWSIGQLFKELSSLYKTYTIEGKTSLPALEIQYADYAVWQREWIETKEGKEKLDYWQKQLDKVPELIDVPTDYPRPKTQTFQGATHQILIPDILMSKLKKFSQEQDTTLFVTLLAALKLLLFKWTRQQDLVIGTVIAGRNRIEIEPLIGCFMNFLALRSQVTEDMIIKDCLKQENQTVLDAYTNQDYPFEKVVEAINPERNTSHNPIYNIALLLQNFPRYPLFGEDLEVTPIEMESNTALLDQRWEITEDNNQTLLQCEYSTDLFKKSTIKDLVENYVGMLEKILENPSAKIRDLETSQSLKEQAQKARERDKKQTIIITSTFTVEPIEDSLSYWMEKLNLPSEIKFTAYNQVFQEILNPDSQLNQNTDGVNLILIRPEDWLRFERKKENNNKDWESKLRQTSHELINALEQHHSRLKVPLMLAICPPSPNLSLEKQKVIRQIETILMAQLKSFNRIQILSSAYLQDNYPVADYYDANRDELGHIPYTELFYTVLGTAIARKIYAIKHSPYKLIILDCDNTLWTGVCGEDGVRGIMIDEARQSLQNLLAEQQKAGKLLCLCSKNQEEDVWAVFEAHSEMPLKQEHLVAWKINWQPKSENIKALAQELNLGLDSFIFIDDNPVECAEVRANCPEVLTLQLPENLSTVSQWLKHIWAFDLVQTTAEDPKRTQMYRQQVEREQLKRESLTFNDFLSSLNLDIQIQPMSPDNLPRVSQLTQRTNQFNLSTIRRSEGEIQQLLINRELEGRIVTVKDRFGDYGLVGVMLFNCNETTLKIDTFLLSCRVLGRTVEYEMMKYLGNLAQERNLSQVDAPYCQTAKNQPILDFLNKINFNYSQTVDQGLLFEFSLETLSNLEFTSNETTDTSGTSKVTDSFQKATIKAPWQLITEIATYLANPANILEEIERKLHQSRSQKSFEYVAPRTDTEQHLAVIWQEVLKLDQVGIYDHFFEIGGNSLLATQVVSRMRETFGMELPLRILFEHSILSRLAQKIEDICSTFEKLQPDAISLNEQLNDDVEEFDL